MDALDDEGAANLKPAQGWKIIGITSLVVIAGSLVVIGFAPIGMFKGDLEERISEKLGAAVHIGTLKRTDHFSLHPIVEIRDLRIAQPKWAGKGDMVRLDLAQVKFPILTLLRGRFEPETIAITGLEANLIRTADKRTNWSREKRPTEEAGDGVSFTNFSITKSHFTLRDKRRRLNLAGQFLVTPKDGLRIDARGTFHGQPASFSATGERIHGVIPGSPYPFNAQLKSNLLSMTARGTMEGALNLDVFSARVQAQGHDIAYLDDIVEAGLPATQEFTLVAKVRRSRPDWVISDLGGEIGRSRLTGAATIKKRNGRSLIDGQIHAAIFDFGDLSSDEGKRLALLKRARLGDLVLPDTRINLHNFEQTDGRLRFKADQLLIPGGSVFQTMSGTLKIDHRLLSVDDFQAGMRSGRLVGSVRVDHRSGLPKLATDLKVQGTSLEQMMGSGKDVSGPVSGRIRLSGQGETIREALGRSSGTVRIVSVGGLLRSQIAAVIGQDLGKTIGQSLGNKVRVVPIRCLVASFDARNGMLTPNPVAMDATLSVARGAGIINLRDERINLALHGAAKKPSPLRIDQPVRIGGSLAHPSVTVAGMNPAQKPSFGKMLKLVTHSIGNMFKHDTAPTVKPLNCAAITA